MSIALNKGIVKCVSTDTIREVLRTMRSDEALIRSSYGGTGDPIIQWKECCSVMESSINRVVDDAIRRGTSLVLEGVHIVPSNTLLDKWTVNGGVAVGVVLSIPDEKTHFEVLNHRGKVTRKGAEKQLTAFHRIRAIHDEMVRLGDEHNWLLIEQKIERDPISMITDVLEERLDDIFYEPT